MDCELPGAGGYELARRIRELEAGNRHTPIVAMTGDLRRETWAAGREAGMEDYVAKP